MWESTSMILLDGDGQWDGDGKVIAHWTQLNSSPHQESIPQKAEEQALSIKKEYLAWVYDLGQYKIKGQTLISFLKIFDNFSFWWMTKIAAKSPFLSPCIFQVFKLRALEKLYFEKECKGVVYCGNNLDLHEIFKKWCKELGHPYRRFSNQRCVAKSSKTGTKRVVSRLPFWLQAFLYVVSRWINCCRHIKLKVREEPKHPSKEKCVTIVTYFPNIDLEKAKSGCFWSHYWENFHDLLNDLPYTVNWVWLYGNSNQLSYKDSVSIRDYCNLVSPNKYRHFLLEEFLSTKIFFKSLVLYLQIFAKGLFLSAIRKIFCFSGSKLNFYPLMKYDWQSSFFGKDAMEGILFSLIFDSMAKNLPATPWSIFTWENQTWELALITAWKRHQKEAKIYAYQHSVIIPQDLRPFLDSKVFEQKGVETFPLPEKLILNGPPWESLMKQFGYPEEKISPIEALRYLYLEANYEKQKKDITSSGRVLLVVTGAHRFETQMQLSLLIKADIIGGLKKYEKVTVKLHPDLPVDEILATLKPSFDYTVTSQPLRELLPLADVGYFANSTSGSIEAAYLGIPLIVAGPADNLNLNPLYGSTSVNYVTNSKMLCEELESPTRINIPDDYFYLDNKMTLWKKLLHDQKTA